MRDSWLGYFAYRRQLLQQFTRDWKTYRVAEQETASKLAIREAEQIVRAGASSDTR